VKQVPLVPVFLGLSVLKSFSRSHWLAQSKRQKEGNGIRMAAFYSPRPSRSRVYIQSEDLHKRVLLLDCPSGFSLLLSSLKCTRLEEAAVAANEDDVDG
jgi:hypothetical protein